MLGIAREAAARSSLKTIRACIKDGTWHMLIASIIINQAKRYCGVEVHACMKTSWEKRAENQSFHVFISCFQDSMS